MQTRTDQNIHIAFEELVNERIEAMKECGMYFARPEIHLWEITKPKRRLKKQNKDCSIMIECEGRGMMTMITQLQVDMLIDRSEPLGISYYICMKWDDKIALLFLLFLKNENGIADVKLFNAVESEKKLIITPIADVDRKKIHPYYANNPLQCHTCRKCRLFTEVPVQQTENDELKSVRKSIDMADFKTCSVRNKNPI